jgi:hypothetical protein
MTTVERLSPRTDAAPMAFTAAEFFRGAIAAWLWFLALSMVVLLPFLSYMFWLSLWYTVPWSLGALAVGSPLAYGLGILLRRVTSVPTHLVAFTVLGAGIGAATTALALFSQGFDSSSSPGAYFWPGALVTAAAAAAVSLGWWHTARRALRRDRERNTSCA